MVRRFKPSKVGNLKYEDVKEGPWKARNVYKRIKLRPILKSCINREFQWGKIRASILQDKVQEVWWRWHHDRLKIQRVEGSRLYCHKCNTHGQSKVNPDWFKPALKEWLDLGFDTKEKAKGKKERAEIQKWARDGNLYSFCK